jgi:hypothetical protein
MKIQSPARSPKRSFALAALVAISASLTLTGCTANVSLDAADDSNNPLCAAITVRLPQQLAGQDRRTTDAQATGAWGDPSSIILRCGLPEVDASLLKCVTVENVDWLVDPSNSPNYRFITFGRNPATEVIVDSKKVAGVDVLSNLALAIQNIPAKRTCSAVK